MSVGATARLRGAGTVLRTTVVLALAVSTAPPAASQIAAHPEVAARLSEIVRHQALTQPQNGLSAAVAFPDGSVWAEGFGCSDLNCRLPILPQHRFGFASITKTYTAAIILQMAAEGLLALDDRLGRYVGTYTHVNAGITIRQLLGHQSGVYNFTNNPNLEPRVWSDLSRKWSPNAILTDFLRPSVFFAGFGAQYSNSNYVLLQLVIEAVAGRAYHLELRERLLDELNLSETWFGPDEAVPGDFPRVWVDLNGDGVLEDFTDRQASVSVRSIRGASGGMIATSSDVARWAQALFSGTLVPDSLRTQMLTFHALSGVGPVWTGYGLGIQQYQISGRELWGHSGLIRGSTSLMVHEPTRNYSIALVDNDARSTHLATAGELVAYLDTIDMAPQDTHAEPILDATAGQQMIPYPNPVSRGSPLFVAGLAGGEPVELVDMLGRVRQVSRDAIFVTTDLKPGVYALRIRPDGYPQLVVVR